MGNYREYPPEDLQAAMEWLQRTKEVAYGEIQTHCETLQRHLQELVIIQHSYFALQQLRKSTAARDELAKELYRGCEPAMKREDNWPILVRRCLAAADVFLEQSGEKKVLVEEVEEALREVLGRQL